jgi:hypothetical protein
VARITSSIGACQPLEDVERALLALGRAQRDTLGRVPAREPVQAPVDERDQPETCAAAPRLADRAHVALRSHDRAQAGVSRVDRPCVGEGPRAHGDRQPSAPISTFALGAPAVRESGAHGVLVLLDVDELRAQVEALVTETLSQRPRSAPRGAA